jgi:methyl-accepting chemotaxis protein
MAASHLGPRPLDRIRSVKVKLGLVVVGAVVATVGAIFASLAFGLHARFAFAGGLVVSLVVIQLLAHGMVLPLRQMVSATQAMARGDYSQRVTATAQDEVGSLARSFNTMAAKLDEVERQRRELVANGGRRAKVRGGRRRPRARHRPIDCRAPRRIHPG